MNKCVIAIDVDGTLANWMEGLRTKFALENPGLEMAPASEFTEYHVRNKHPEWYDQITRAMTTKGFYSSLPVIPGAQKALKDIEENCLDFIEPFLCSSPDTEYEDQLCHSEKAAWILKHFGKFWLDRLVLTRDKTLCRAAFLIDDKPEITGALTPVWQHVVYRAPWNQEHGDRRFDWSEWEALRDIGLKPTYQKKLEEPKSLIILP